jgi:hypothetical protein
LAADGRQVPLRGVQQNCPAHGHQDCPARRAEGLPDTWASLPLGVP